MTLMNKTDQQIIGMHSSWKISSQMTSFQNFQQESPCRGIGQRVFGWPIGGNVFLVVFYIPALLAADKRSVCEDKSRQTNESLDCKVSIHGIQVYPSKHGTLCQCWFNVGSAS